MFILPNKLKNNVFVQSSACKIFIPLNIKGHTFSCHFMPEFPQNLFNYFSCFLMTHRDPVRKNIHNHTHNQQWQHNQQRLPNQQHLHNHLHNDDNVPTTHLMKHRAPSNVYPSSHPVGRSDGGGLEGSGGGGGSQGGENT